MADNDQDPGGEGPAPRGFDDLDALVSKHFEGAANDDEPNPEPTDELEEPADDAENSEEEADEEGGPDDELEDEDEADEEDPDEEEDEEPSEDFAENVSAKDLRRIEQDPALSRAYRALRADYTRKTQDLAVRERDLTRRLQGVSTPEGMTDLIVRTWQDNPALVGAAFEAVLTQKGADTHGFLVEVGLSNPEALEKALERVQELQSDEAEMRRHKRDTEQTVRERTLARREEDARRATFGRDYDRITAAATAEAKRLGVDKDDMPRVTEALKARVRGRVQKDGSIDLSAADIRAVARETKAELDREAQRWAKRLGVKQEQQSREATKKLAAKGQAPRPKAPRSPARKPAKGAGRWKPPATGDGMDAYFNQVVEPRLNNG